MQDFPIPDTSQGRQGVEAHPAAAGARPRTLLLVEDEGNIVSALKRLLRREGYVILTAGSGTEGLALLESHAVDVILSDQRMPGMTGVEFLSIAKTRYPNTVRIVLSGYSELQSVFDAVNRGAIYKFLTKPWDDHNLRDHIREAFEHKELAENNHRLMQEVQAVNSELAAANRQLELSLVEKQQQVALTDQMLAILREVLQQVDLPVLAVDDTGMIAFVNEYATGLLQRRGAMLGGEAQVLIPEMMAQVAIESAVPATCQLCIEGERFRMMAHAMGTTSQSRGWLFLLTPSAPLVALR